MLVASPYWSLQYINSMDCFERDRQGRWNINGNLPSTHSIYYWNQARHLHVGRKQKEAWRVEYFGGVVQYGIHSK